MGITTDSEVRFVARQSILNHGLLLSICIALTVISVYLTYEFSWSMQTIWSSDYFSIKIPLFALVPLVLIARLLHATHDKKIVFTDSYILFLEGLMSWKEKSIRLHYFNIKEIEIDQTIYQRMFGLSDLLITTVATQIEDSLRMPGLRRARVIKDFINERMSQQLQDKDTHIIQERRSG